MARSVTRTENVATATTVVVIATASVTEGGILHRPHLQTVDTATIHRRGMSLLVQYIISILLVHYQYIISILLYSAKNNLHLITSLLEEELCYKL